MTIAAPIPLHRNPVYAKIWLIGLFCGLVRWLEMLAFGLYAVVATGSPFLTSLLILLRFLPLTLFGVLIGAVADLVNPRRLLILSLSVILIFSAGMWTLFLFGEPDYWHVAVAAFVSGAFWAGDMPLRRKMIGEAVAEGRLAGAMAIDGATSNGTRMLGPLFGGLIFVGVGMEGVFALAVIAYAVALIIALNLPLAPATPLARADILAPFRGAVEAARYSIRDPDVARILLVTIIFNIWGFPYLAMIPVIGAGDLGLSPDMIGYITAGEGLFALIGAVLVARIAKPANYRALYIGGTGALFLVILTMGLFPSIWSVTLGLALGGLVTSFFAAMQATLIYAVAPPAMRGRFLGLMTICIGAGVLGFANVGLTAEAFGAANALWIIALEGLIPIVALGWGWRKLWSG